ncbi:OmpA family protein [Phenylobacterium deserti]|uniref:OmpA family protein n=1 Tax=Phenylobacterium deserti TaxID=1914756 RepID=A0A328ARN1_9CAUL|nr:OmpA family protein [Phenylobacterium deserti]RAK57703.1 OmpA family protein [Phenylobacterium deserti]
MRRSANLILLTAGLAVTLAGCSTVQNARERLVRAPVRCVDQTVQIYFEPDAAELTSEGRAVIKAASEGAAGCEVRSVEVVGLTDATGAPQANLELSRRRAQSVTAALAASGLPAAEFRVAAVGDAGAVTADGRAAPLRRRADVILRLQPR